MQDADDAWASLAARAFDLLVVGGGIHGAAIARDAALRGLSVALVEARDWGWATSAKSSRLAHGGLRYLEQFDLGLVHEALQDRERYLRDAPHHVRPLRFLYPLYPHIASRRMVGLGLLVYDVLSHGKSLPNHSHLSRRATLAAAPGIAAQDLGGSQVFWDAQIQHVERLVAEQLEDACAHGAVARNYTRVVRLLREGERVAGAIVEREDGATATVRASATINATGAWVDATLGELAKGRPPKVRLTKGIHLVVPRFVEDAFLAKSKRDGRTFFILPWNDTCIIGTTDTDYEGDAGDAAANANDVRYLVEETRRYFPSAPVDRILFTFAGVRALVNQAGLSESRVTRRHILYDHGEREGVRGLWTLQGGKITTSRSLAEATVDAVARFLGNKEAARSHPTRRKPYPRAPAGAWTEFLASATNAARGAGIPDALASAFVGRWGTGWQAVWACDGEVGRHEVAGTGHFACEVAFAVRQQHARHLEDVMLRRTTLGLRPGLGMDAARATAEVMARILGWDVARVADELASYARTARLWAVPSL